MIYNLENIRLALGRKLPGSDSHKKMLPPNRDLTFAPDERENLKRGSVLLLLFQEKEDVVACLIKRPRHMKFHPGQIALPGGRIEKEETALTTALRETLEEIGIASENISIIGCLSELYVAVSGFLVQPFVGWISKKPEFAINQDEVEKLILFPLFKYRNNFEMTELETVSGRLQVPCIRFENEIIWGATAMILSEFYDLTE